MRTPLQFLAVLAALSSLTASVASAAPDNRPLGELLGGSDMASTPALAGGPATYQPVSAPQSTQDPVVKPRMPANYKLYNNEPWKCTLLAQFNFQIQMCGGYSNVAGNNIYREALYFNRDGSFIGSQPPTQGAPQQMAMAQAPVIYQASPQQRGCNTLQHEPTREMVVATSDGQSVCASSYEKPPSFLSVLCAFACEPLAQGIGARIANGGRGGGYGYYGNYVPSQPTVRGGSCGGCVRPYN